jgi:hypothetical protein
MMMLEIALKIGSGVVGTKRMDKLINKFIANDILIDKTSGKG